MKCQKCGQAIATVHVLQINDSGSHSLRLCPACAGRLRGAFARSGWDGLPPDEEPVPRPNETGSQQMELGAILGHFFSPQIAGESGDEGAVCPSCGFQLERLSREARLGCASCYTSFRRRLRPVIQRFHRHLSHLGRVPSGAVGDLSQNAELARMRVALERAIATEDFEEAARLRDRVRALTTDR